MEATIWELDFTDLARSHTGSQTQLDGFSGVEPIGCWTDGQRARLVIAPSASWPLRLRLNMEASPFVAPDIGVQTVTVTVNGQQTAELSFSTHFARQSIAIPLLLRDYECDQPLEIVLDISDPGQPSHYGMSDDGRQLGMLIHRLDIAREPAAKRSLAINPYKSLPDHQYWRKAISFVEAHRVDPVTDPRFQIGRDARVGTAGSCFAQHISRRIMASGFNYFVTEVGEGLSEADRRTNNYSTFSARYGNIYTTTQLLQLFEEAFGERTPLDRAWVRPDTRYVDPFRQQIQPAGFVDEAMLHDDRRSHLAAVRRLFEETDIFVFTLGLTEAWRSKLDGSVFSAAPGVIGNTFQPDIHEFVNFDVAETYGALHTFLEKLHAINLGVKVLLTVSPVPLIATYEPRSVLTSTTYSKAVLRVAAEMALKRFDWVDYFPSYEIITGSFSGGLYYETDCREVNPIGVSHAMRCFMRHYVEGQTASSDARQVPDAIRKANVNDLVCDEEILDAVKG